MLIETRKLSKREVNVTTSIDVAETFGKRHDNVLRDIKNIECSDTFRLLNFEETVYVDSHNRTQTMYYLTKNGFTLLVMGYTGEKAARFKEDYINQFDAMEELIKGKLIEREKGIAVRNALTKAIDVSGENERMHNHAYSTYTNLVYKAVFGKNANQLREEYGITKKDNLREYFSAEELAKVQSIEMVVSGLVNCGWGFEDIKEFINNPTKKLLAA